MLVEADVRLQGGSERKVEDSSCPRAVVNYQRSARHPLDSKPGAVAPF
jgi:hypothetical protein